MSCHLEFTDSRFVFAGKSYPDIPLLVDSQHQFVTPVCDYLRHLLVIDNLRPTSVRTYADYLMHFWNHLEEKAPLTWDEVCDKDLIYWLNIQEVNGVSELTRCARCDAVFDFYVWLESNSYIRHVIRIPGWNDSERFVPRLTAVANKGVAKNRRGSKFGIVSAVRPRVTGTSLQPTPNADDLTNLYIVADNGKNPGLTERNHLLIDWYSQVGLRRHEFCHLALDQIPDWDSIYALQERNEAHELKLLVTKGGRHRHVGVIPELLEKTREYIEGQRAAVVARFKASKGSSYKEPPEVFLSEKTGQPMVLIAISNLLTHWFKASQTEGHGHRLRATYLTNLFEAEIAAEEARVAAHPGSKAIIDYELILLKVAERAGHSDIASLRPYLTLARKRRVRQGAEVDPVTLQQQIAAMKQELAILEARIHGKRADLDLPPKKRKSFNE